MAGRPLTTSTARFRAVRQASVQNLIKKYLSAIISQVKNQVQTLFNMFFKYINIVMKKLKRFMSLPGVGKYFIGRPEKIQTVAHGGHADAGP